MLGAILAKRAVAKAFDAIDRHDTLAVVGMFREDGTFEFPGHSALSGCFKGQEAIQAWFERWFQRMPQIHFTLRHISVEDIFALSGTNTVHVEWDLDEADQAGRRYHITGVTAFDVVGGKARSVKDYIFDQDLVTSIWPRTTEAVA